MKKLIACLSLVLVAALGVVGFSACKKTNVVGKWVAYKYVITDNGVVVEENTDLGYTREFIIYKNKTAVSQQNTPYEQHWTWKKSGNKLILQEDIDSENLCELTIKKGNLVWQQNDNVFYYFKKVK